MPRLFIKRDSPGRVLVGFIFLHGRYYTDCPRKVFRSYAVIIVCGDDSSEGKVSRYEFLMINCGFSELQ